MPVTPQFVGLKAMVDRAWRRMQGAGTAHAMRALGLPHAWARDPNADVVLAWLSDTTPEARERGRRAAYGALVGLARKYGIKPPARR